MVLVGVIGEARKINRELMLFAAENTPSLILDCANCANPHALYPAIPEEKLDNVFVLEVELLYKLRDTLRRLPIMKKRFSLNLIVVTTIGTLINYGDEEENKEVMLYCWELLKKHSATCDIHVALAPGSAHEEASKQFCDVIKNGTHSLQPTNGVR